MTRTLIFFFFLLTFLSAKPDRKADHNRIMEFLSQNGLQFQSDIDTVVSCKGYSIRVKQENDSIIHLGLNLFNPEWKNMIDEDLLAYIERDLLMQLATEKKGGDSMIIFNIGNLSDIKKVDQNTACHITTIDSRILSVEWTLDNGDPILISAPISYDILRGGTRAEIEEAFISQLKKSKLRRNLEIEIDPTGLQPYGETEYILPGAYYINDQISRNIYLYSYKDSSFVWDSAHPLESISNLFICDAGERNPVVDLTIIKHDYGEKEDIRTDIENLISVAELEGCVPYWGVESYKNGIITGSLFLNNPRQYYDHVLKIECKPEEIIAGIGKIKAKAYLYIPSNNISNINESYRVKTEDEKIRYWDN